MFDSISSIAGRIAAIDERARRLNVAWGTDGAAVPASGAGDAPAEAAPAAGGTTAAGSTSGSAATTFAAAMADTTAATASGRATSRAHATATTSTKHAATAGLDAQLGALKGGSRASHASGVPAAARTAAANSAAAKAASAAPAATTDTPAAATAETPAASAAPAAAAAATPAATSTPAASTSGSVTTSGTVTAADDATAPVIDPALGAYGYRSAAAWDPSGPVGQLVAKYGVNHGTYIDLGSPAAVVGRGATPEEMKILAGSGAFGTPGTYPGLDYSYFTGLEGTTGIDKLADGTPVPAGMAVWTVYKNGQVIHQEIAPPNIDSTKMSIKYLGFA